MYELVIKLENTSKNPIKLFISIDFRIDLFVGFPKHSAIVAFSEIFQIFEQKSASVEFVSVYLH